MEPDPIFGGITPREDLPARIYINVHGREEHEALLRDPAKCRELGVDHAYEVMIYLNRWGSFLYKSPQEI